MNTQMQYIIMFLREDGELIPATYEDGAMAITYTRKEAEEMAHKLNLPHRSTFVYVISQAYYIINHDDKTTSTPY